MHDWETTHDILEMLQPCARVIIHGMLPRTATTWPCITRLLVTEVLVLSSVSLWYSTVKLAEGNFIACNRGTEHCLFIGEWCLQNIRTSLIQVNGVARSDLFKQSAGLNLRHCATLFRSWNSLARATHPLPRSCEIRTTGKHVLGCETNNHCLILLQYTRLHDQMLQKSIIAISLRTSSIKTAVSVGRYLWWCKLSVSYQRQNTKYPYKWHSTD